MGFDPAPFLCCSDARQKKRLPIDVFPRWRKGTCHGVPCSHLAASQASPPGGLAVGALAAPTWSALAAALQPE